MNKLLMKEHWWSEWEEYNILHNFNDIHYYIHKEGSAYPCTLFRGGDGVFTKFTPDGHVNTVEVRFIGETQ